MLGDRGVANGWLVANPNVGGAIAPGPDTVLVVAVVAVLGWVA
ncbi:hypothetical protein ACTXG6_34405 [Pseudonocardia sp. Cha107L01]